MFCKWCGMESATTDVCSWCHHTLTETAPKANEKTRETEPQEAVSAQLQEFSQLESANPGTGEIGLAAGITASAPQDAVAVKSTEATSSTSHAVEPSAGTEGKRPIIGVRRPGAARTNPAPIASVVPRSSGTGTLEARNPAPGGGTPIPAKPVPAVSPPTISARQDVNRSATPTAPPTVSPVANHSAPVPVAPILPKRVEVKPKPVSTEANNPKSDSGDLEEVGLAAGVSAPSHAPAPATGNYAPQLGTFEAQNSKYYTGQVVDPVSGAHYDAATGQVTAPANPNDKRPEDKVVLNWDEPQKPGGLQMYAGIVAAILVVMGVAIFATNTVLIPILLANFASGMLLPILRVGPWQDEDADDSVLFMVGTFVFGPLVMAIIYGIISAVRGGGNASILGLSVVALVSRVVAELASGSHAYWGGLISPWKAEAAGFSFMVVLVSWAGLAGMVGWVLANTFHKADE